MNSKSQKSHKQSPSGISSPGKVRLSIIIVNYNVKYFLEQALQSVNKALRNIPAEIFVVDNNSVDGSVEMVKERFPQVKLIANKKNAGFSTANNQAIRQAQGEYVLLLNPDTVVEEDCFEKTLRFMDNHPEAGALGVKMIDGKGNFLPESKRALPTPEVAFYKIFGLSSLFPNSKRFGKYHLSYLNENEIHEVEVLPGAFMLIRKTVLDEAGLLDESFFMYGEDIDLSYRITQAGYKNYYFPETRIIHYKGESTKKGSLNYVRIFYNAMILFAEKHFSKRKAKLLHVLIKAAVYLRAAIAVLSGAGRKIMLPIADALLIYAGMYLIKDFWQENIKEHTTYPPEYMYFNVPLYIFIWLVAVFFSGGYDKPFRAFKLVRGIVAGTVLIAAVYGFLEEEFRFSRAMIILGAVWAVFATLALRVAINFFRKGKPLLEERTEKRLITVGSYNEAKRILSLLNQMGINTNFIGFVTSDEPEKKEEQHLGTLDQLQEIVSIYKADEIIFCSKDISSAGIIEKMTGIGPEVDYKIVPEESISIIGSNSKNTAGDLYAVDINLSIEKAMSRRNKRMLDFLTAAFLLISFPINLFFVKKPLGLLKNIILVLTGKKTWVGYAKIENKKPAHPGSGPEIKNLKLPHLRQGVLSPLDALKIKPSDKDTLMRLNILYAKDYSPYDDLHIIWKGYASLGKGEPISG